MHSGSAFLSRFNPIGKQENIIGELRCAYVIHFAIDGGVTVILDLFAVCQVSVIVDRMLLCWRHQPRGDAIAV